MVPSPIREATAISETRIRAPSAERALARLGRERRGFALAPTFSPAAIKLRATESPSDRDSKQKA
jgi:hypothetical protein